MTRCSVSAAFFDSNILIYAVDPRESSTEKRNVARDLITSRRCTLSTQVLMETFNTLTRLKLMAPELAQSYIGRLSAYSVVSVEAEDVKKALENRAAYKINHWDGLILTSAEKVRLPILYTEDLSHGQVYGSVRACNPFIEDFLSSQSAQFQ